MDGLENPLSLIARHGAFLLLVLPVVGALLVVLSAPWGREVVLRTALTNVAFAIAIAALVLMAFDLDPPMPPRAGSRVPQFQMTSSAGLEPLVDDDPHSSSLLRLDVGVDGINLWFVALLPLATLMAIVLSRNEPQLTSLLAILLLLQGVLTGFFAAVNVVMLIACLEVSTLLLLMLMGRRGNPELRRELVPLAVVQFAGGLLVLFGLLAMVVAHHWLTVQEGSGETRFTLSLATLAADLPLIVRESTPTAVAATWRTAETLIFWTLLPGLLIKSFVFPFHRGVCTAAWPPCAGVFVFGVFPCLGAFGFLRIVAPVCEQSLAAHSGWITLLLLLGSAWCGLLALAQGELYKTVSYASVAHTGLAFAAAGSLTSEGISGCLFHLIGHIAGFALLTAAMAGLDERYQTLEIRAFGGLGRRLPWVSAAWFAWAFTLCGIPGLSGFPALWQTVNGLLGSGGGDEPTLWTGLMSLAVIGLLAWALLSAGQRIFWGTVREPLPAARSFASLSVPSERDVRDWTPAERIPVALLAGILLAVGTAPQFVAARIDSSLKHVLNVPEGRGPASGLRREGHPQ